MSAAFATFLALIISIWVRNGGVPPSLALIGGRLRLWLPPAPSPEEPPLPGSASEEALWQGTQQSLGDDTDLPLPSPHRLPGHSLAIQHHVHAKKTNKFRPFLGGEGKKKSSALLPLRLKLLAARPGCSGVPLCRFPILIKNERIDFLETHGLKKKNILYFAWFIFCNYQLKK